MAVVAGFHRGGHCVDRTSKRKIPGGAHEGEPTRLQPPPSEDVDRHDPDSLMTKPQFYKPPQQLRSQETLDRILDAAEQVLAEKSFGEATLAEIMERAGVTVGAFYRRYPDKNALLRHLDERFFAEMLAKGNDLFDPERWPGATAHQILEVFVAEAV